MPNIKSSTDLRNNYNEISKLCRETKAPKGREAIKEGKKPPLSDAIIDIRRKMNNGQV